MNTFICVNKTLYFDASGGVVIYECQQYNKDIECWRLSQIVLWFRSQCKACAFFVAAGAASVWGETSLKHERWKDDLHVMPVKTCLQLDLQKKSDISAHYSTSPSGRGLEGRDTDEERERQTKRVELLQLRETDRGRQLTQAGLQQLTHKHTQSGSIHIIPFTSSSFFTSSPCLSISRLHSLSAVSVAVNQPTSEPSMLHHHISNQMHSVLINLIINQAVSMFLASSILTSHNVLIELFLQFVSRKWFLKHWHMI